MDSQPRSKEQRILRVMRKVLSSIVKDVTPRPGEAPPLSDQTIADIRECFGLIAAREKELAEEMGIALDERPMYPDQTPKAKVMQFAKPARSKDASEQ